MDRSRALRRALRRLDQLQRRRPRLALAYGVVKKYGDDTAGSLAALITYYGFLSLFPLLLVLVTVLGIVAAGHPALAHRVEHSALSEFPVIGTDIGRNLHALRRDSVAGLVIGLAGLVWGAQGSVQIGQQAMADVWNIPGPDRPGTPARIARSLLMLGVLGVFLVASTVAAGVVSFARTVTIIVDAGSIAATLILDAALYLLAFRILTPRSVAFADLVPGALIGGALWTALQYGGTLLVDHELRGSNNVYGLFGIVLGLLAWISLGARTTMYAAEVNVVRARHLWPRSIVQPPLTDADQEVYAAIARQARQFAEQHVEVDFRPPAGRSEVGEGSEETPEPDPV